MRRDELISLLNLMYDQRLYTHSRPSGYSVSASNQNRWTGRIGGHEAEIHKLRGPSDVAVFVARLCLLSGDRALDEKVYFRLGSMK